MFILKTSLLQLLNLKTLNLADTQISQRRDQQKYEYVEQVDGRTYLSMNKYYWGQTKYLSTCLNTRLILDKSWSFILLYKYEIENYLTSARVHGSGACSRARAWREGAVGGFTCKFFCWVSKKQRPARLRVTNFRSLQQIGNVSWQDFRIFIVSNYAQHKHLLILC